MRDQASVSAAAFRRSTALLAAALAAAFALAGCGGEGGGGGAIAVVPAPTPTPSPTSVPSLAQLTAPTIAVIPNVGRTASVTPGSYTGAESVSGQWLADGVPISGATAATYAITAADDGKVLSYRETATKAGASAVVTTVAALVPVMPPLAGTLLAEGDSALEGVGASSPAKNWISQFAAAQGASLTNRAVAGYGLEDEFAGGTLSNARLTADAVATKRDFVIVAIGGNDTFQSATNPTLNPTNFAAQLRQRLNLLRLAGYAPTDILLGSLYPISDAVIQAFGITPAAYAAFNAPISPIVQEYGVRFIDFYSAGNGVGDPGLISPDGLHPNDAGYYQLYLFALYKTVIPNRKPMPGAPVATSPGAGRIAVSWAAAAGSPIGYTVEREAGGTLVFANATDTSATGITLSGLASGSYRVRVRANYADGTPGPWAFATVVVVVA